jgi:pyruvate/2-oxoacid:ferredoxin oxidoreductase beta subunit
MRLSIDRRSELLSTGHLACAGCAAPLAMRYALTGLGDRTVVVIAASCWSIICGPFPHSAMKVPAVHTVFASGAVTAAGVRASLDMQDLSDVTVLAWSGDGGTFDIGLQSLSGAAERNDDIIYVCYDNEAYMNTGVHRSSSTPWGAWTTTTPRAKDRPKKNIMEIMAAHRIPYAATASIAFPEDFIHKMQKAKGIRGMRFFHVLAPCPTGWRVPSAWSVKIARLAMHTNVFPLYEVEDGTVFRITVNSPHLPVRAYLEPQGRFRHLNEAQVETIQRITDRRWDDLQRRVNESTEAV